MREITLKKFRLKYVEEKEQADLVLSEKQDETDFLALGTYCLHLIVEQIDCEEIKIYKEDFSNKESGVRALTKMGSYELSVNAFSDVAIKYIKNIANHIIGKEHINNMILGVSMYLQVTAYYMGIEKPLFLKKNLPKQFNMQDTIQAEEAVQKLIVSYIKMWNMN